MLRDRAASTAPHAILGTSEQCIATHPSRSARWRSSALDATVHVRGRPATRTLRFAASARRCPAQHPERETALRPGELITCDRPSAARRSRGDRSTSRCATARASRSRSRRRRSRSTCEDGTIRDARVALGGVATKPWRSHEAEHALIGKPATRRRHSARRRTPALAGARAAQATTRSRSSSRSARWCARSRRCRHDWHRTLKALGNARRADRSRRRAAQGHRRRAVRGRVPDAERRRTR